MDDNDRRIELQYIFENIMKNKNVYFQPPESLKINYPAIVYERSKIDTIYADDNPYVWNRKYQVTLIDKNPDSVYIKDILKLKKCKHIRHFTVDNLNHDVFEIYY